ncbi:MAG: TerB family tellurite resistance protein [Myxococcota bacterium]
MVLDFFAEQELNFEQVKCLTAGMYTVAKVDGVHDREMTLIRGFYQSCARAGDPSFETVLAGDFDLAAAKRSFDRPELAKMFVKSLILLAFADGQYAKKEDEVIRSWSGHLGLSSADVDQLLAATKDFLLQSLSHVQNVDALKDVAKRLELK